MSGSYDQYLNAERDQQAPADMEAQIEAAARQRMQTAQGQSAEVESETPEPVNIFQRKGPAGKLSSIVTGMQALRQRSMVELADVGRALSLQSGYTRRVEVEIGTVPLRAVLASGILPPEGRRLTQAMLARSEEITKMQREKVGLDDMFQKIVEQEYDGDAVDAATGSLQLSMALACLGVKNFYDNGEADNPPLRLVMNENDFGFWVGLLSDAEVTEVSNAVWARMEEDAKAAEPFPRTGNPPRSPFALNSRKPSPARAGRPDDV